MFSDVCLRGAEKSVPLVILCSKFTIRSQERHDLSLFFGYHIGVPGRYNTNTPPISPSPLQHTQAWRPGPQGWGAVSSVRRGEAKIFNRRTSVYKLFTMTS